MINIRIATAFCVAAILPDLRAQTSTAQITGRISDLPDAVVEGAQIRVFLTTSSNLTNAPHARLNQWFNASVFSQPAAFSFETTSRTLPDVRSHGINKLDFALDKNNPIGRDGRVNLPQYSQPRQIQVALKLIF